MCLSSSLINLTVKSNCPGHGGGCYHHVYSTSICLCRRVCYHHVYSTSILSLSSCSFIIMFIPLPFVFVVVLLSSCLFHFHFSLLFYYFVYPLHLSLSWSLLSSLCAVELCITLNISNKDIDTIPITSKLFFFFISLLLLFLNNRTKTIDCCFSINVIFILDSSI